VTTLHSAFHRKRRLAILCVSIAAPLAATGGGLAAAGAFNYSASGPSGPAEPLPLQVTPAAQAMAKVFAETPSAAMPSSVDGEVTSLVAGAPLQDALGKVLLGHGRVLLSNLGPDGRAIYAYPTDNGQVCVVMTGLGDGCMRAFLVGEPVAVTGGSYADPPQSGPPAEFAGLTQDNVTGVQIVVNGTPHDTVFGNDAWYYRFPDNQTPDTAATALLVTLKDGSTVTVPTRTSAPQQPPTS
jgi:hypothetical protein